MNRKYKVLKSFLMPDLKKIESGSIWEVNGLISQFEKQKITLNYIEKISTFAYEENKFSKESKKGK